MRNEENPLSALILILHEEDKKSQQVTESLKKSGHNIFSVKTFNQAIAFLKSRRVDLIISDVHLENGGSVFDFLKWVRGNASTKDVPFVMLSCQPTALAKYLDDAVKTTARLLGAAKYITMDTFDSEHFRKQIDPLLPGENPTIESSITTIK